MMRGKPLKYEPLRAYLVAQTGDTVTLTLTPEAIETILGAPLPASARIVSWWGNSRRDGHSRAWLDAGWRVTGHNFRLAKPTVTFTRVAAAGEQGA